MSLRTNTTNTPNLTVETSSYKKKQKHLHTNQQQQIIKIIKRGEYVCAKKKLDELFFQWVSQPNVQDEIKQLVKLVRSGKKTNLVQLRKALSPTKEPPRSPSHSSNNKKNNSKNIFSNALSTTATTTASSSTLSFDNQDANTTTTIVNERLGRKAATLINDVDNETKANEGTSDNNKEEVKTNHDNVVVSKNSITSLTDEEVNAINSNTTTQKKKNNNNNNDEDDIPSAPTSPSLMLAPEQKTPTANIKTTTTTTTSNNKYDALPKFYFPNEGGRGRGKPILNDRFELMEKRIQVVFKDKPNGIKPDDFVSLTKEFCGLPSFLSTPLHTRVRWYYQRSLPNQEKINEKDALAIDNNKNKNKNNKKKNNQDDDDDDDNYNYENALVTYDMFKLYWKEEIEPYDLQDRFFRLLKKIDSVVIYPSDFEVVLKELLAYHPGLEFLENTPEFQEKYARTVVARIFYSTDVSRSWSLRRRDVRKSNPPLLDNFIRVDEEEDINVVHNFFSYEHFYVLYCKFWELDTDHDFLLSRDDLLRYGGHALTRRIVDRVFEQAGRRFLSTEKGKMTYEDFVYFMLSEEDKSNVNSLEYWFNCIDLDGDGEIRPYEMRSFYDEQLHRMECLGHEMVPFTNIITQMMDIVNIPPGECVFRMEDFKRGGKSHMALTSVVFNMLFNLNKFIAYEQRDPFMMRQQRMESGDMTPWSHFACLEYARLAMEEEG